MCSCLHSLESSAGDHRSGLTTGHVNRWGYGGLNSQEFLSPLDIYILCLLFFFFF